MPNASLLRVTENKRNIRKENLERNPAGAAESYFFRICYKFVFLVRCSRGQYEAV